MKTLLLLLLSGSAFAQNICPPPAPNEPITYTNDFKWGMTLEEMGEKFDEIYASGKRLQGRAYYDPALKSYIFPYRTGPVKFDRNFIQSVTRHLEIALQRRYADYVFFPDMGHSHFYMFEADWKRIVDLPMEKIYEEMLKLPTLKILYHTAEQLKVREGDKNMGGSFPQDRILLWRYFSRNPVGDNQGGENIFPLFNFEKIPDYNTVGAIEGYHEWSSGFNVQASKNGCFSFTANGKTMKFDLSLEDLPYKGSDEADPNH